MRFRGRETGRCSKRNQGGTAVTQPVWSQTLETPPSSDTSHLHLEEGFEGGAQPGDPDTCCFWGGLGTL